jgi:hypothetical protein
MLRETIRKLAIPPESSDNTSVLKQASVAFSSRSLYRCFVPLVAYRSLTGDLLRGAGIASLSTVSEG